MWQTERLWATWLTTAPFQKCGLVRHANSPCPVPPCPVLSHTPGPGTVNRPDRWLARVKTPRKVMGFGGFANSWPTAVAVPWAWLAHRQEIADSQNFTPSLYSDLILVRVKGEPQLNISEVFITLLKTINSTHLHNKAWVITATNKKYPI